MFNMQEIVGRFVDYIKFDTASDHDSHSCPSTDKQIPFARYLFQELRAVGFQQVTLDENGYVMATLPSNGCEDAPVVGFIAHMDTSPDASGGPVGWQLIKNYDGGRIILNQEKDITMSPEEFPELASYKGQHLLVTDGTTLLGADDKAGICAIISAGEYLLQHPEIPHGTIRIAFTPDEEIGKSSEHFDVDAFGADFAYTVDGGAIGGLEYENFNAANAAVVFKGRNVHTGDAKNKMINALTMAAEWQQLLPQAEQPETTDGYEGFYHCHQIKGDVSEIRLGMLIRDHDRQRFEKRKAYLKSLASFMNDKYGQGRVELVCRDVYYNMRERIEPVMHIVELAKTAMERAGIKPVISPIRGGTDGARLSFKGLPCPNIFTGGHNFHGIYEYLPVQSLEKSCETVVEIIRSAGQLKRQ